MKQNACPVIVNLSGNFGPPLYTLGNARRVHSYGTLRNARRVHSYSTQGYCSGLTMADNFCADMETMVL